MVIPCLDRMEEQQRDGLSDGFCGKSWFFMECLEDCSDVFCYFVDRFDRTAQIVRFLKASEIPNPACVFRTGAI